MKRLKRMSKRNGYRCQVQLIFLDISLVIDLESVKQKATGFTHTYSKDKIIEKIDITTFDSSIASPYEVASFVILKNALI